MTKAELQKSNDAMARFLAFLCRISDKNYNGYRSSEAEAHYRKARRLIKRAGIKYAIPRRPQQNTTD